MWTKADEDQVLLTFDTSEDSEPVPPSDIVSFNELRSCADLFRLYTTEKLEIQPDFQREVVWKESDQSRFVDSLVKQLPIPSMCFSLDYKTQKWKVIDGLQRMNAIISFLGEKSWKLKELDDIHPMLRGKRNIDLKNGTPEERMLFSTVLDVSIPITVLRCDYSKPSHMQYLFTIFHRLNSGGVRLTNQEIRNCIFNGHFNTSLKDFDRTDQNWKEVKKRIWGSPARFRSVELLLRTLAFSENLVHYDGNLARYLNNYMQGQLDALLLDIDEKISNLRETSHLTAMAIRGFPQKKLSLTFVEATMVGILANLDRLRSCEPEKLRFAFSEMLEADAFSEAAKYAISSERNVKQRMEIASGIFSKVA